MQQQTMRIGAVAPRADVNIQTVRYYERRGLLPKPPRTESNYRLYSEDSVRRVRFVKRAQELGFSLKEIKELLALRINSRGTRAQVRERAEDHRHRGENPVAPRHEKNARAPYGRLL